MVRGGHLLDARALVTAARIIGLICTRAEFGKPSSELRKLVGVLRRKVRALLRVAREVEQAAVCRASRVRLL